MFWYNQLIETEKQSDEAPPSRCSPENLSQSVFYQSMSC